MGWQPIATAPRDGTPILIPTGNDAFPIACVAYDTGPYLDGEYGWKDDEEGKHDPTHWMPVPPINSPIGAK